ncbi:MAG TPA: hypothetical protein VJN69_14490 [Candidatus Acidoferrales bacterium]|nr:hypothetical protein [Candidatus Acidoferrales bacterium]
MTNPRFDDITARLAQISEKLSKARDPHQRVLLLKEMRVAIEQAQAAIQEDPLRHDPSQQ